MFRLLLQIIMPKLWLAIFFGYNGSTFNGMQFQLESHVYTIEGVLVEKLHAAGFLPTTHFGQLQKQERWSRAARTDKGVHAVLNGVSCLFTVGNHMYNEDGTLNKNQLHLEFKELFEGTQIVYHCFKRVTSRFQIRHMVKSRHYAYVCPKLMFVHKQPYVPDEVKQTEDKEKLEYALKNEKQSLNTQVSLTPLQEQQLLKQLNQCCNIFLGTHNFHNYSKNLRAKDPQAQRYIIEFKVASINSDFLVFDIVGQSFIYHQIRKMIGSIMMVIANNYPPSFINNTFFRNQIHMPLAPAQGLFLVELNFGGYNRKNDIPDQLIFTDLPTVGQVRSEIEEYIMKLDRKIWTEWIDQLKKSIYHGIEYKVQEEDNEKGGHNDQ